MKNKIKLNEQELHNIIFEAVSNYMLNEGMEEGFFGDLAHKGTNWARRMGRKAEKFGNNVDNFNQNVADTAKNTVNNVKTGVKNAANNVAQGAKNAANAVGNAAKTTGNTIKDIATLNQRVTRIEQQLGIKNAMEESIDNIVDKVLNEYLKR